MIPTAYIQEWSTHAPWPDSRLIEQDLIICRALCALFNAPALAGKLAFRGGTAIHKLLFKHPLRYSEDIDLVQLHAESIGSTVDAVRECLSWLGNCSRDRGEHSTHLMFRFAPDVAPDTNLKLKIEINTREHENLLGVRKYPFVVDSGWYQGKTDIVSFQPEELFGTKLRALLQRRKNRDLFDLNEGLSQLGMDASKLIACFEHYLKIEGKAITRAAAEQRMLAKLMRSLAEDVEPLLPVGIRFSADEAIAAFNRVWTELIVNIRGGAWKRTQATIDELRNNGYPLLLREAQGGIQHRI